MIDIPAAETHNQQASASDGAEGSKDGDEGDGWVEEEVLEEHVHPETGVVKRALSEEPANGPKRLRAVCLSHRIRKPVRRGYM